MRNLIKRILSEESNRDETARKRVIKFLNDQFDENEVEEGDGWIILWDDKYIHHVGNVDKGILIEFMFDEDDDFGGELSISEKFINRIKHFVHFDDEKVIDIIKKYFQGQFMVKVKSVTNKLF
jgi:hypothetical protein